MAEMNMVPTGWLDVKEAARYVHCSGSTLRRAAMAGSVRAYKLGRKVWRFRASDLDAWLQASRTPIEYAPREKRG